jgi:glycine betaine transporter
LVAQETVEQRTAEGRTAVPGPARQEPPRHGSVFWITVAISLVFVVGGVVATDTVNAALQSVVHQIISKLGWLYLLIATFFLGFVVWLAFSRYGRVTLGEPGDKPEFRLFSWFAMLFQAGMGIGLMFWGVAEPVTHFHAPPFHQARPATADAAALSIQYAFFHWTLHPWAMYAVVGLAIAFFSHRRGQGTLQVSSVLRPVLGHRVDGAAGVAVDVLAIVATLFGIGVSLGLGTLQIDAGLHEAFGVPKGLGAQLAIIGVTAAAYMLSASTPLERGIQGLSNVSMVVATLFLGYFVVVGPTVLELNALTQGVGDYGWRLLPMSLRTNAFAPDPWLGTWTVFFWATWIAWAPYVGAFIARISRGRTIRQFVVGVLLAPSLFTMLWFGVFGAASIDTDRAAGGAIGRAAHQDAAVALFAFIRHYPLFDVVSGLVIFLVWIFFVAGADAGTVVLGSMSSRGELDPGRSSKMTWGLIMAAIAATLLIAGGLDALQNGAILAATPFALIMLLICWSLVKALQQDERSRREGRMRRDA